MDIDDRRRIHVEAMNDLGGHALDLMVLTHNVDNVEKRGDCRNLPRNVLAHKGPDWGGI